MKFFIPKRGDTVLVRTIDGRAINAIYLRKHPGCKRLHFLTCKITGNRLVAVGFATKDNRLWSRIDEVRFIGPSAVMEDRS